jgi:hypothetical protein
MNKDLSLVHLMGNNDEDFLHRIQKRTKEVEKDKAGIMSAATEYSQKYHNEIVEGTKKRQLMIENGARQGLSPEESLKNLAVFIPDKKTPILNMLYFLLHEYDGASDALQILREEKDKNVNFNQLKNSLNERFGGLTLDEIEQDIPDILEFVYENVTIDIFNKVKKLKALSRSPNKEEAFSAYTKCMELCKKYNLDFDKVPCDV